MHELHKVVVLCVAMGAALSGCAPSPMRQHSRPGNGGPGPVSTRLQNRSTSVDPRQDCNRFNRLLTEGGPLLSAGDRPDTPESLTKASKRAAEDERFVPIFGRPLDQFTDRDFELITYQSMMFCLNNADAPLGRIDPWQKEVIHNLFMFNGNVFYRRYVATARVQGRLLDDMRTKLHSLPASEEGMDQLVDLERRGRAEGKNTPGVHADQFEAASLEAEQRIVPVAHRIRVERLVAAAKGFADVKDLWDEKRSLERLESDSTNPVVKSALAIYVPPLTRKISELETQQADEELRRYESFAAAASGDLETMMEAKSRESKLLATYGGYLDHPEFKPFNDKRKAYRDQWLMRNTPALSAKIARAQSGSDIGEVFDTYVVETDQRSAAAVALRAAAEKQTLVVEPFTGLSGDDYLNAVYGGDWDAVRRLDKTYLSGMTKLLGQTGMAGDLMKPLFDKATLLIPVLRSYLFKYDSRYAKCIGPGAVTLKVVSRTDMVTTNGLNQEVARQYGNPQVTKYTVNKEFGAAFERLGENGDDTAGTAFGDLFLNGGKATRVLTGTDELMGKFACNDPRIKRFERNLLSMYEKARRL